ncbi:MAG: hypothetical protein ACP5GD_00660 [Candidatus Micrarchaeia archaeon]
MLAYTVDLDYETESLKEHIRKFEGEIPEEVCESFKVLGNYSGEVKKALENGMLRFIYEEQTERPRKQSMLIAKAFSLLGQKELRERVPEWLKFTSAYRIVYLTYAALSRTDNFEMKEYLREMQTYLSLKRS